MYKRMNQVGAAPAAKTDSAAEEPAREYLGDRVGTLVNERRVEKAKVNFDAEGIEDFVQQMLKNGGIDKAQAKSGKAEAISERPQAKSAKAQAESPKAEAVSEKAEAESGNAELLEKIAALEAENQDLKTKNEKAETENGKLNAELKEAKEANAELVQENQDLREGKSSVEKKNADLEGALEPVRRRAEKMKARAKRVEGRSEEYAERIAEQREATDNLLTDAEYAEIATQNAAMYDAHNKIIDMLQEKAENSEEAQYLEQLRAMGDAWTQAIENIEVAKYLDAQEQAPEEQNDIAAWMIAIMPKGNVWLKRALRDLVRTDEKWGEKSADEQVDAVTDYVGDQLMMATLAGDPEDMEIWMETLYNANMLYPRVKRMLAEQRAQMEAGEAPEAQTPEEYAQAGFDALKAQVGMAET